MSVRVKICGLTTSEAVVAAVDGGADALGFVFAPSPRQIAPQHAAKLVRSVPPQVARVAVFHHPSAALLDEVLAVFAPDWVQAEHAAAPLFASRPAVRFLPVFRDGPDLALRVEENDGGGRSGAASPSTSEAPFAPSLLVEAATSGRGLRPDWERVATIAPGRRLVLAGGLDPENVVQAIRRVSPWGVDVSSGVESSPGVKDPTRIAAFLAAVRHEVSV